MPPTIPRLAGATAAAASMVWPFLMCCGSATAEPSPGVPCLDLVQQLAAEPPSVPESLQTAANALNNVVPEGGPVIPPAPKADVVHGVTALAAPGPVPPPIVTDVPVAAAAATAAAPVVQAAAAPAPLAAPPVPVALLIPPVPPLSDALPAPPAPAIAEPVVAEAVDVVAQSPAAVAPAPQAAPVIQDCRGACGGSCPRRSRRSCCPRRAGRCPGCCRSGGSHSRGPARRCAAGTAAVARHPARPSRPRLRGHRLVRGARTR